jgi:hypothetical protein
MKKGDIVQVRQTDGVEHWLYAKVLDPDAVRVHVLHPGNHEHRNDLLVDAADIRTKNDVEQLLAVAQTMSGAILTNAQIKNLGAADGWVLKYLEPEQTQARNTLHMLLVPHYQAQVNQLS